MASPPRDADEFEELSPHGCGHESDLSPISSIRFGVASASNQCPEMARNRRNRVHVAASAYSLSPVVRLSMSVSAIGNDRFWAADSMDQRNTF